MDIKNNGWIVEDKISLKEKEVLFILLETAGFPIQKEVRSHESDRLYPYLAWRTNSKFFREEVYAYTSVNARDESCRLISYKKLTKELKELIKQQIKQQK